jgi:hypothetical protein
MHRTKNLLGTLGLGAGLMFLLDPYSGGRRWALIRDRLAHCHRKLRDAFLTTFKDLKNRTAGLVIGAKSFLKPDDVTDQVLAERIRSKLGRVCSHARAIEIECSQAHVTLRGSVLAAELEDVVSAVSSVRGVRSLENRLEPHQEWHLNPYEPGNHRAESCWSCVRFSNNRSRLRSCP